MKHKINNYDEEENFNISKRSPLKTFFLILAGLFAAILSLFILLIFVIELIMPRMPEKFENYLGEVISESYIEDGYDIEMSNYASDLLNDMVEEQYRVFVVEADNFNAFAIPGKIIVINTPIMETYNDDIVRFVLAHEVGHFENNDHMQFIGRSFLSIVFTSIFSSEGAFDLTYHFLETISLVFSRNDEKNADLTAIDILYRNNYNVYGGIEFLNLLDEENGIEYFSTHPKSDKRIRIMEEYIKKLGY